jgi:2-dehydropantoate 2-reductase
MRILVLGAGATGGYFGGRLAQAGRDVTFLVRAAHVNRLRAQGLRIVSPHGDVALAPKLVTADAIAGPYDVVLLTVKAYSLDKALDDVAPAIGSETMILPVLNGMRHVDLITARFGRRALVGCVCKVATDVDAEGRIVQLAPFQELAYGEMDGAPSARTGRLDEVMQGAGFDARLSGAIVREMWEKWILLASLGGVTCLMRGTVGEIEAAAGGREFASRFLGEATHVAETVGEKPSESFLSFARNMLTEKGSPLTSSMYRDLDKNRPIEADQIVGDLVERGRKAGLDTPLLAAAYAELSVYQNRLARS